MNKINKVRKGEVRIYKGMTYVAVPEINKQIIIYENRRTNNSIFSCEQEW